MKFIIFLHFYQPQNQQEDILHRIVNESYRPIIKGLLDRPHAKIVGNVSGVLTKLLQDRGYEDVLVGFQQLLDNGQLELVGSGMYHAILPLLPMEEVVRQIDLNEEANRDYFGDLYQPTGFFSPEMAVSDDVLRVVADQGYEWFAAPELSYGRELAKPDRIYVDQQTGLKLLFRHKRVSMLILSAAVRSADEFIEETPDIIKSEKYWFAVMDAETFGHHRIGHEKLLFDFVDSKYLETIHVRELFNEGLPEEAISLRPCTWSNEEQDFWLDRDYTEESSDKTFNLWHDETNPIHVLQWKLTNLVIDAVRRYPDQDRPEWLEARKKLDSAIASDQYWWASARPWWSLEMIEQGAFVLKDVLVTLDENSSQVTKADNLYRQILDRAFDWQRTGYIRKRFVEASGTYMGEPFKERSEPHWYNEIVLAMEVEINKAVARQQFEKAIKWRDALIKMDQGSDIYDILHVVDDFWMSRNMQWGHTGMNHFFSYEWDDFSDFAKSHFIEHTTRESFEQGKEKYRQETQG